MQHCARKGRELHRFGWPSCGWRGTLPAKCERHKREIYRGNGCLPRRVGKILGVELSAEKSLAGVKVMVIDDSNTIRRSAEIFLLQAGCTVILAEDGFDALAKIADHQPELIFVDIMMPRLDGYQTCALIKKNQKFRG